MTTHRSLAAALWLLAGAIAFAVCSSWIGEAQSGKLSPWALVAFFWGVAAASVAIHYLSQGPEALRRYRLSRRSSAQVPSFSVEGWRPAFILDWYRLLLDRTALVLARWRAALTPFPALARGRWRAALTPFPALARGRWLAPLTPLSTLVRAHWPAPLALFAGMVPARRREGGNAVDALAPDAAAAQSRRERTELTPLPSSGDEHLCSGALQAG
jgi:hypothetical protein